MTQAEPRRRIAIVIEYDGAGFSGSQRQKNGPSIQEEMESAIEQLTRAPVRVSFAGRTDAGVHALGQVTAFSTEARHQTEVFVRGLNALLPESIAVRCAREVAPTFDPRRDAAARTYRYTVYSASERSPLRMDRAWHVPKRLDHGRMAEAADVLVGEHDFAAFSRREPATTIRRVFACRIERDGALVTLEMTANAFLRQQVRRTAGALVAVGLGKHSPASVRELLAGARPSSAGPVAPARGLVLVRVAYLGLDLMM